MYSSPSSLSFLRSLVPEGICCRFFDLAKVIKRLCGHGPRGAGRGIRRRKKKEESRSFSTKIVERMRSRREREREEKEGRKVGRIVDVNWALWKPKRRGVASDDANHCLHRQDMVALNSSPLSILLHPGRFSDIRWIFASSSLSPR